MADLTKEIIPLLQYLLPGFVSAWVFYAFTSYTRPSQFERIVQALIFTYIVHLLVSLTESAALNVGKHFSVGFWSSVQEHFFSFVFALLLGAIFAYFANSDKLHQWVRDKELSQETSFPSEWFSAFHERETNVILHLKDERRLSGWPSEWPSDPATGHFNIMEPLWQNEDGTVVLLPGVQSILISVEDVRWVEFIDT